MEEQKNNEIDIVKYYTFEHDELRKSFVKKCQNAISDYSFYMKMYQLFRLRIDYTGSFEFDNLLYTFVKDMQFIDYSMISRMIKDVRQPKNSFNITSFLNNLIFKNISCIREFFCFSTFPSIFYDFISEQSFELGYNFIKSFFDEPKVMPLLVSSFLHHSMIFQDRLFSTFLNQYINDYAKKKDEIEKSNKDEKLNKQIDIFYNSLKSCTSYLNQFQIKIIKDLKEKDEETACYIVSELFLKEVITNLSKYHSISNDTNVIVVDSSLDNPPNTLHIKQRNVLVDLYDKLDPKKLVEIICDSKLCCEFSNIQEMLIDDGYNTTLSVADIKIISYLWMFILLPDQRSKSLELFNKRHNASVNKGIKIIKVYEQKEFINDICTFYFNNRECFNKNMPTVTYTMDEMKKSQEVREYRKFLMKYSNHLNNLLLYLNSTNEILTCKMDEFVNKILLTQQVFNPSKFEFNQIKSFVLLQKPNDNQISNCKCMTDFFKNEKQKPSFINIDDLIENLHVINKKNSNNDPEQEKRPYSRFIQIVEKVSYLLYMTRMNKENSSKDMDDVFDFNEEEQKDAINPKLINLIKDYTNDFNNNKIPPDSDDFFQYYDDIRDIIVASDKEMKIDCLHLRSQFNIGRTIKTFITIVKLIQKSIQKSVFEKDENLQRFIIFWIFHPKNDEINESIDFNKEIVYFKANLIKARLFLDKMINDNKKSGILMPLKLIEANKSLEKLAIFCNMKKE